MASGLLSRARERPDAGMSASPAARPSVRSALSELSSGMAAARLVAATPRLLSAPRGDGHVVVDIPGWKAPELSGAPMRAYLRALGYDARGWGLGTNTGDPRRDVERLTGIVLDLVEDTGAPVSLVGWSLGGVIAREVARQAPGSVHRVITYGTPVVGGTRFASPIRVPLTVIFTRRDGIVAWQACIDRFSPSVEHVEVSSTHIGMGIDPDVWAIVAERLARDVVAAPS